MVRKVKGEIRISKGDAMFNDDRIENVSGCDSLEELKGDSANKYLVYEHVSNFSRVYLATGFDETEAFEQCNFDSEDLLGIELIEFVN